MNAEVRVTDDLHNFSDARLTGVIALSGTAYDEATMENCKNDRLLDGAIRIVKRTVEKDLPRIGL